jgi:predicted HicB family RNase H-like nuclease
MLPKKDVQINIRIDRKLKEAATRAARADHRTLSSLIIKLLEDHLGKTEERRGT